MPVEDTVPAVRKAGLTVAAMGVSMAEKKAVTVSTTGMTAVVSMATSTATVMLHLLKNRPETGTTVRTAARERP